MFRLTETAGVLIAKAQVVSFCPLLRLIGADQANCYPLAVPKLNKADVRHPPRSRWLDEWGRLNGGRPLV